MPQLLAPLCFSILALADRGQQVSTHSIAATATFAPRTALTVSSPTLRFIVTDPATLAYATVDFSAAARTVANGEVALVMRLVGDVPPDAVFSITGGSDGVVVGAVPTLEDTSAARWIGSGQRAGRVTLALSARPGIYDIPVEFFLKLS